MTVASLILFMASFFQISILNRTNNLSLRFIVGKFRGRALFNIIYGAYFPIFSLNKKIKLSLGFRIEKKIWR